MNPFFVPPDEFLRELSARAAMETTPESTLQSEGSARF
jgi:hypothetical protein